MNIMFTFWRIIIQNVKSNKYSVPTFVARQDAPVLNSDIINKFEL